METIETISLILGASWASGINLYATVLMLGWLGGAGHVDLPPDLAILSSPGIMIAAGLMYFVEFFTDKIPGLDTVWDALHTFVRIPAGALLAAGAAEGLELGGAAQMVALLLGGSVATVTHATKASTRALINTSPEPVSNWTASLTEDLAVLGGLWAALNHPWVFLALLLFFLLTLAWLLPRLLKALKRLAQTIRGWLAGRPNPLPEPPTDDTSTDRGRKTLRRLYDKK